MAVAPKWTAGPDCGGAGHGISKAGGRRWERAVVLHIKVQHHHVLLIHAPVPASARAPHRGGGRRGHGRGRGEEESLRQLRCRARRRVERRHRHCSEWVT